MGMLDPVAAVILGGLKGLLILGVIFGLVNALSLSPETNQNLKKSVIRKAALDLYNRTYPVIKENIPKINSFFKVQPTANFSLTEIASKAVNVVSREVSSTIKRFTP